MKIGQQLVETQARWAVLLVLPVLLVAGSEQKTLGQRGVVTGSGEGRAVACG